MSNNNLGSDGVVVLGRLKLFFHSFVQPPSETDLVWRAIVLIRQAKALSDSDHRDQRYDTALAQLLANDEEVADLQRLEGFIP